MKEVLIYIVQATILLTAFYGVYKILFARDTFLAIKRMVLIFGIVGSLVIPAVPITIYVTQTSPETPSATQTQTPSATSIATSIAPPDLSTTNSNINTPQAPNAPFDWTLLIFWVYLPGVIALLLYRCIGLARVMILIKNSQQITIYQGIKVLKTNKSTPPFCFSRKIIISEEEPIENLEMILAHERSHIDHRHNVDLTIINFVLSFMWFNPAIWLLRKELILLQEYQADRQVLQNGIDAKKYQYLLISRVAPNLNLQPVVNHFGTSYLHKRISMMKKQSKPIGLLKLLAIAPMLVMAVLACAQIQQKPTANNLETKEFTMPFSGKIASQFGEQINPLTKKKVNHNGIDVITDNDTIVAPFSGEVTFCEFDHSGYGNKLVVAHPNNLETTYAHLAKFLVSQGATVKSGDPIAIVGNTGRSTGKHLHFECRVNGEVVDPYHAIPALRGNTTQNYTLAQLKALQ